MTTENINPRKDRGEAISKRYNQIKRLSENQYKVQSQSSRWKWYDVFATESGWKCTCADHTYRQVCCKHIHAIEFSIKIRKEVREQNTVTISPTSTTECIYCKSENITKDGLRHNKYGDIQKFNCKSCNRYFTINIGFEKMKHDPKGITTAMQLYFSGESLRNVAKSLRLLGMDVTHQTVYNWIAKYTGLMEKYLDQITPQVGEIWRADEIFVKVKGNPKYLYAMMDDETRFWIAKQVAEKKYMENVRPLFKQAAEITERKPKTLITDGARNFGVAFRKEYQTWTADRPIHIRHIHLKGDMNNNKMERLNGEIRDREKVMRGLKKMDSPIIEGYRIFHNYIRLHQGLGGRTPSEACGINIGGANKWLTIIQNASKYHEFSEKYDDLIL